MSANPNSTSRAIVDGLHHQIGLRLGTAGQRYTTGRRQLVDALAKSGRPVNITEILKYTPDLPLSSAYRTLAVFTSLGITRRIAGADENGYFELSEDLSGSHHHHAICETCGKVVDIDSSPKLEKALSDAARIAGEQTGFTLDTHRMDLVGTCADCVKST